MGGGGVDGAIHEEAGPELLDACKEIRRTKYPDGLPVGEAVATPAFDLPARIVIHTVAPKKGKDPLEKLRDCYLNALRLADRYRCESIAFPALGTGAYGIPIDYSAQTAKDILTTYKPFCVRKVFLVLLGDEHYRIYKTFFHEDKENTTETTTKT
ncbi:hypothetical protein D6783_04320 [Candidatus Woesearchaeota archaeon]|nr:MAG: hypothetical protein D6783_04320 [Candidatus Woesearchaeota archaeon]